MRERDAVAYLRIAMVSIQRLDSTFSICTHRGPILCVAPKGTAQQSCALCPSVRFGSMVTLGGFFVLLLDVARSDFRVNPCLHGSARWADLSDIKTAAFSITMVLIGPIVPTLLSWRQSIFVTDLKGELYELTAGWRHEYGHNKILRFGQPRSPVVLIPEAIKEYQSKLLRPRQAWHL